MFEDVLSQEKAVLILKNFISTKRLPQSIIFYGPRGVGKFLTAKSMAKYFLCLNIDEKKRGSDDCSICSRIEKEIHPDYLVVRTEKTVTKAGKEKDSRVIRIDQIKEVIKKSHYKPYEAENKFFIIDGAETMNMESGNSFLKTLEEPLPNNYIILICHNINKVLPTIFSRCIKVEFYTLKENVLKKLIKDQFEVYENLAKEISMMSYGSMHNAGILIENDMYKKVFKALEQIIKIITTADLNIEGLFALSEELRIMEIQYVSYLLDLLLMCLNESYLKTTCNIERKEFFKYYLNFKSKSIKLKSFSNVVDEVLKAKYYLLGTNVNVKLLIENLIIKARENLL